MANEQNLLTPEQRNLTSEEARRMGRLGGKASAKARRRKRDLKANLKLMGELKTSELVSKLRKRGENELAAQLEEVGIIAYKYYEMLGSSKVKSETKIKILNELSDRDAGKTVQALTHSTPEGETIKFEYQGLLPATKDLLAKAKADREQLDE